MIRIFKQEYPLKNILLILSESISICASIYISHRLFFNFYSENMDIMFLVKIFSITVICQLCLYYNELYMMQKMYSINDLGIRIFQSLGFSAIFLSILYIIFPNLVIETKIFAISVLLIIVFITSWRFFYTIVSKYRMFKQNIVILGSNQLTLEILDMINRKRDYGYNIAMIIPENPNDVCNIASKYPDISIRHHLEKFDESIKDLEIKKIIISFKEKRKNFPVRELLNCRVKGIDIIDGNSFYESICGKILVENITPGWLIFSEGFNRSSARYIIKRISDIIISSLMLILLSPLICIISLVIKMDSRGPVLYRQERNGEGKLPFKINKFRSMIDGAEKACGPMWAVENDCRVTRAGKYLRKFRLDEIPQLWNVLKGEMSFVGPRPERECFINELEKIIPYYSERFIVKPGITGWAQVSYRYGASTEDAIEKLNYDLFYIKNMTFFMDLMIIFRTVKTVLFGETGR